MKRSVSVPKPKVKATIIKYNSSEIVQILSLAKPELILNWYDNHRRIMPWRALPSSVSNPYYVWLSEIMLQQTTVAAVGPYFQKFIKRWPQLHDLANSSLSDIMKMWAGLGYYRRARLLHDCAKELVYQNQGEFPQSESELLKLPGIGPYTAAAITAIAFNRRANVVDGNVERVVARLFAVREPIPKAKKTLRVLASMLLPTSRYGDYAQALMDLGATVCTPRNPNCKACPWNKACQGHQQGIADLLPQRIKASIKPVRRAIAFVLSNKKGQVYLRQRPNHGLLGGMMEIPSSEWCEAAMPDMKYALDQAPCKAHWTLRPGSIKHIFTHFELEIAVATALSSKKPKVGRWVSLDELKNEALPSLMHKIIRHTKEWL